MRSLILASVVLLSGCAQWETMEAEEKNLLIATTAAALVIGYYANDGDTTVIQQELPCTDRHCRK